MAHFRSFEGKEAQGTMGPVAAEVARVQPRLVVHHLPAARTSIRGPQADSRHPAFRAQNRCRIFTVYWNIHKLHCGSSVRWSSVRHKAERSALHWNCSISATCEGANGVHLGIKDQ